MNHHEADTKALEIAGGLIIKYLDQHRLEGDLPEFGPSDYERLNRALTELANNLYNRFYRRMNSGQLIKTGRGRPATVKKAFFRTAWEANAFAKLWQNLKAEDKKKPKGQKEYANKYLKIDGLQIETNLTKHKLRSMFGQIQSGEGGVLSWFNDSDGKSGVEKDDWSKE